MRFPLVRSIVLGACLLMQAACSRPAPEQALRDTIAQMQSAMEARDADALDEHVAEDFIGPDGMDRKDARRMAQLVFLRNRDIGATLGPLQVSMQGEHATVRFSAALTGGSGALLPDSAQVYEVTTGWRMRDDEWELVSAEWKPRI
jgi:ketosteroid isomerase-like protein